MRAVDGELGIQDFLQRFVTSPVSLASDMAGLNALGSLYQVTNSADLPAGAGRPQTLGDHEARLQCRMTPLTEGDLLR